jgi:hypothetical protein
VHTTIPAPTVSKLFVDHALLNEFEGRRLVRILSTARIEPRDRQGVAGYSALPNARIDRPRNPSPITATSASSVHTDSVWPNSVTSEPNRAAAPVTCWSANTARRSGSTA